MLVTHRRLAGILLPLFSIRSRRDWGVGELPDLARFAPICERAGLKVLTQADFAQWQQEQFAKRR